MRRLALAFALATPLLQAQEAHYEGPMLVESVQLRTEAEFDSEGTQGLVFILPEQRGRNLVLPPELDGRLGRCLRITHHHGVTYALGRTHLGLPQRPGHRGVTAPPREKAPVHLWKSQDGRTWKDIARVEVEGVSTFLPLEDGSFLLGRTRLFWQGDAASPFARFVLDGSALRQEGLMDLGLGTPVYRVLDGKAQVLEPHRELDGSHRRWHTQRLPSGLLLLHGASGRWFLLDAFDGHPLRQGRLWAPGEAETASLAARPDGRALVAAFPESRERSLGAWGPRAKQAVQAPLAYPADPGAALLVHRCQALETPQALAQPRLRWLLLDPFTDPPTELAPPRNFPPPLDLFEATGFSFTVRPDGTLRLRENVALSQFRQLASRRWLRVLRLPLRLPLWMSR